MEREYNDLIGDILKNTGEKDQVKGKGKPLPKDYLERDVYQNFQKIAKDAGYLPEWLKLQKQISESIHQCQSEEDIKAINEKIMKHNKICPPPMQKNLISLENLAQAKKIW
ncbi:DnaJ family domain-containing protein [Cytobacillus gottheilii]|uniref:DnaJ family domain-containing protein n=1 Tax=Cytobacillus gottheilii TaxID=859144 RepID=UPI00082BA9AD|nr:DnaJ family domain-containing protein [Cytobacillus gottheilii]